MRPWAGRGRTVAAGRDAAARDHVRARRGWPAGTPADGDRGVPAANHGRTTDTRALTSLLHVQERRKRKTYTNHLLRVTIRILSHYRVADPDVACAALLHDAVENHAGDIIPAAPGRRPSRCWPSGSAHTPPPWSPRSPTPNGSLAVTSTSSIASTSSPAWPGACHHRHRTAPD